MRRWSRLTSGIFSVLVASSMMVTVGTTAVCADELESANSQVEQGANSTDSDVVEQAQQGVDASGIAEQDNDASPRLVWQGDGEMPAELKGITNPEHMWSGGAEQEAWEIEEQSKDEQQGAMNGRVAGGCYARVKWDAVNGAKRFSSAGEGPNCANKKVFAPAWKVLDVSEHQANIDWNKVKGSGIDAVILRTSFGYGFEDGKFEANLREVRRLRIPFGIYHYSYAYNKSFADEEAKWVLKLLRQYNVKPDEMALPVFYDLEQGDWGGNHMPKNASGYRPIVDAFISRLSQAGYKRTHLYTYLNFVNTKLNTDYLKSKVGWIAQYNNQLDYNFASSYGDKRGWQYTSADRVNGVTTGNVDMSVFDAPITTIPTPPSTSINPPSQDYTGWVHRGNDAYWFQNGRLATNREIYTGGCWYWVGSNGKMAKGVTLIPAGRGTKWVYYDINSGRMQYGERYLNYDREHTGWYNFHPVTGEMIKGITKVASNGGKTVYYDVITGKMRYGEQHVNYNNSLLGWYYFDTVTGAMQRGVRWVPSNGGKWVYYDIRTGKMRYGSLYLNYDREHTGWYYFDPISGKMAHGYTRVNGRLVYYDRITGKRR